MKTIILILIALSLNASSITCDMARDTYKKNYQYLKFAKDKKNYFETKWYVNKTIGSIERVMVECQLTKEQLSNANSQRDQLLKISKQIKRK